MIEGGGGGVIAALFVHSEMRENGDERLDGGRGPKFSRCPFFITFNTPRAKKIKKETDVFKNNKWHERFKRNHQSTRI
jgi:hypothetical protein